MFDNYELDEFVDLGRLLVRWWRPRGFMGATGRFWGAARESHSEINAGRLVERARLEQVVAGDVERA